MRPYDMISADELTAIQSYIHEFSGIHFRNPIDTAVSLREWNKAKQGLFDGAFGGSLIKEYPIEFNMSERLLRININTLFDADGAGRVFWDLVWKRIEERGITMDDQTRHILSRAVQDESLVKNHLVIGTFWDGRKGELDTPNRMTITLGDKTHVITSEMRTMRVLGLYADYLGLNAELEQFRLEHSQVLNQKTMRGTLCLSIHPLDYMTMSDNEAGWSSCMSWKECGCYRAGTIEMMNSDCVVVAYLKSDKNTMRLPSGLEWNSKKWRSLVVVSDELITTIKNYPYYNEDLCARVVEIARDWQKDIKWLDTEIVEEADEDNDEPHCLRLRCGKEIYFESGAMYNDFGYTRHHICVRDDDLTYRSFYYSGARTCIGCGEEMDGACEEDLVCDECIYDRTEEVKICPHCGNRIRPSRDNYRTYGDEYYCPRCYREIFFKDAFSNEYRKRSDATVEVVVFPDAETAELFQNATPFDLRELPYALPTLEIDRDSVEEYIQAGHLEQDTTIKCLSPNDFENAKVYYLIADDIRASSSIFSSMGTFGGYMSWAGMVHTSTRNICRYFSKYVEDTEMYKNYIKQRREGLYF